MKKLMLRDMKHEGRNTNNCRIFGIGPFDFHNEIEVEAYSAIEDLLIGMDWDVDKFYDILNDSPDTRWIRIRVYSGYHVTGEIETLLRLFSIDNKK